MSPENTSAYLMLQHYMNSSDKLCTVTEVRLFYLVIFIMFEQIFIIYFCKFKCLFTFLVKKSIWYRFFNTGILQDEAYYAQQNLVSVFCLPGEL